MPQQNSKVTFFKRIAEHVTHDHMRHAGFALQHARGKTPRNDDDGLHSGQGVAGAHALRRIIETVHGRDAAQINVTFLKIGLHFCRSAHRSASCCCFFPLYQIWRCNAKKTGRICAQVAKEKCVSTGKACAGKGAVPGRRGNTGAKRQNQ
jgi:hypothetical protein